MTLTYSPCPNNCGGEIAFDITAETNDNGDGPWLQSYTSYIIDYNSFESCHEDSCPKLTDEQISHAIDQKQKQVDEEPYEYLDEPL